MTINTTSNITSITSSPAAQVSLPLSSSGPKDGMRLIELHAIMRAIPWQPSREAEQCIIHAFSHRHGPTSLKALLEHCHMVPLHVLSSVYTACIERTRHDRPAASAHYSIIKEKINNLHQYLHRAEHEDVQSLVSNTSPIDEDILQAISFYLEMRGPDCATIPATKLFTLCYSLLRSISPEQQTQLFLKLRHQAIIIACSIESNDFTTLVMTLRRALPEAQNKTLITITAIKTFIQAVTKNDFTNYSFSRTLLHQNDVEEGERLVHTDLDRSKNLNSPDATRRAETLFYMSHQYTTRDIMSKIDSVDPSGVEHALYQHYFPLSMMHGTYHKIYILFDRVLSSIEKTKGVPSTDAMESIFMRFSEMLRVAERIHNDGAVFFGLFDSFPPEKLRKYVRDIENLTQAATENLFGERAKRLKACKLALEWIDSVEELTIKIRINDIGGLLNSSVVNSNCIDVAFKDTENLSLEMRYAAHLLRIKWICATDSRTFKTIKESQECMKELFALKEQMGAARYATMEALASEKTRAVMGRIANVMTLHALIEQKETESALQFLREADGRHWLDGKEEGGALLLHAACSHGLTDVALRLIALGVNANAFNANGETPLMIAYNNRHLVIVRLLIENNADLSAQDSQGNTLLHRACQDGNLELVSELIQKGAPKDIKNRRANTPLIVACRQKHTDIGVFLIAQGANYAIRDSRNMTVCMIASFLGLTQVVWALIHKGVNLDEKAIPNQPSSALTFACMYGQFETAKILIENGASIRHQYDEDTSSQRITSLIESLPPCRKKLSGPENHPLRRTTDSYFQHEQFWCNTHTTIMKLIKYFLNSMIPAQASALMQQVFRTSNIPDEDAATITATLAYTVCPNHYSEQLVNGKIVGRSVPAMSIPPGPTGTSLDLLQDWFTQTIQPMPERELRGMFQSLGSQQIDVLQAKMTDYLAAVKTRRAYMGTPRAGSPALEQFYQHIEWALQHVIHKVQNEEAQAALNMKRQVLAELIRASGYCGPRLQQTAMQLYREHVQRTPPTLQEKIYERLDIYRRLIAESLAPPTSQTIHYYDELLHELGQELGLADAAFVRASGTLRLTAGGMCVKNRDRTRFFYRYHPHAIYSWLSEEIEQNSSLRQEVIDWLADNIPQGWTTPPLQAAYEMVAAMRASHASSAAIGDVLEERHNITMIRGRTLEQAIAAQHPLQIAMGGAERLCALCRRQAKSESEILQLLQSRFAMPGSTADAAVEAAKVRAQEAVRVIQERVQILRSGQKTEAEIVDILEQEYGIRFQMRPSQTPEEALAAERRSEYIERICLVKRSEPTHRPPPIASNEIYRMLVAFNVVTN